MVLNNPRNFAMTSVHFTLIGQALGAFRKYSFLYYFLVAPFIYFVMSKKCQRHPVFPGTAEINSASPVSEMKHFWGKCFKQNHLKIV